MEGLGWAENEKSCGQRRGRNPVRLQGLSRGSNFGSNGKPAKGLQKCPSGRFGGAGREARRSGGGVTGVQVRRVSWGWAAAALWVVNRVPGACFIGRAEGCQCCQVWGRLGRTLMFRPECLVGEGDMG